MTLRYRVFIGESKDFIENYISSLNIDKLFAKYVASVLLAHLYTLMKSGIVDRDSGMEIAKELIDIIKTDGEKLYKWIERKKIVFEDVFEAIEAYIHEVVDNGAGYIAIGRSRNDHVSTVLRLFARDTVLKFLSELLELRKVLLEKAIEFRGTIFPFFTHQQLAQCGSSAIYFLSHEYALKNAWDSVINTLRYLRENPLSSGPAAGSMIFLDRDILSRSLCLEQDLIPPYYATGSRFFLLYPASSIALTLSEIGRLVEDFMIISSTIPNALEIPKEHIATSSIMPHKKNLVTLEISRAKIKKVIGLANSLMNIYTSIPYGYNLDLQEMNAIFIEIMGEAISILQVLKDFIKGIRINENAIIEYVKDKPCWSSEIVEYIAYTRKRPAREVYMYLSKLFRDYRYGDINTLNSIISSLGLSFDDVWNIIRSKPVENYLKIMIENAWKRLERDRTLINNISEELQKCTAALISNELKM
ncbi:Argininosuccinate lyase [Ignisphaera aggregans DSM 17230]|uniref:Argininosuccinate lyase n=1 Tax=Ignisphaera aggregans (strain DSM 17230 / JCM 13409 / AQ1.S1) TaxID=583356 RepID=E0SS82_IGNAA|nr:Argininosuccinate lyase [Ignisphaera aggregans DSM 17230]